MASGERVAPYVSYDRFRRAWIRQHRREAKLMGVLYRETPEAIIREFWGDYITGEAKSLSDYFRRIRGR